MFASAERERRRLEELRALQIVDTKQDSRFDRITKLAAKLYSAPICLISLVDSERQWFKSRVGLDAKETPRDISFCTHAIEGDELFVVEDASRHDLFADNPLVVGGPCIRSYVGAPLKTERGHRLGTLCLIYPEVQATSEVDYSDLEVLAAMAVELIELTAKEESHREQLRLTRRITDVSKANEQLFNSIARAAKVGGWELDLASQVPVWTRQTRDIHEIDESFDLTLNEAIKFYAPEYRELVQETVSRCVQNQEPFEFEAEIITAKGNRVWVRSVGQAVCFDGEPVKLVGAFVDISQEKAERQRLDQTMHDRDKAKTALTAYQTALDKHAILSVIDRNGRIKFANHNFCDASGHALSSIIDNQIDLYIDQSRSDFCFDAVLSNLETGTPVRKEICIQRADGRALWIDSTFVPILSDQGLIERVVCISYDITERLEIQSLLHEKRIEAEAASIAKSQFLATMSHEIRTPMNGVLGMLDLAKQTGLSRKQQKYIDGARVSAEALMGIINDVLDLSKVEAGKIEFEDISFSIRDMCGQLVQLFKMSAEEKSVKLKLEIDADVPDFVCGDPTRIRQVLNNVIGNSIKFTEEGQVHIALNFEEEQLHVRVRDTGVGMSPEEVDRLFDFFSQGDASISRKYGGTGLGMAISQQLTEHMGGTLSASSTLGEGTEFDILIPVRTCDDMVQACDESPAVAETPTPDVRPLRILIVEDSQLNQMVIEGFIDSLGHQLEVVDNGDAALEALAAKSFDLVLTDIQMPEMDGFELTKRIRAMSSAGASIPIVALTANAMKGFAETCLEAGMDAYVSKPINLSDLRRAIGAVAA